MACKFQVSNNTLGIAAVGCYRKGVFGFNSFTMLAISDNPGRTFLCRRPAWQTPFSEVCAWMWMEVCWMRMGTANWKYISYFSCYRWHYSVWHKHFSLSERQQSDFHTFSWKIVLGVVIFFFYFVKEKKIFLHIFKVDTVIFSAYGMNCDKWLRCHWLAKSRKCILDKRKNWRLESYFLQKQIENFYLITYEFETNSIIQRNCKYVLKSFALKCFSFS